MREVPFDLCVDRRCDGEKVSSEIVKCRSLMRVVPGRREIYDGCWKGLGVVVKIFIDKHKSKRHLRREWRGLNKLFGEGLNSPEPYFFGQIAGGGSAVVVERIGNCRTVLDIFKKSNSAEEKTDMLVKVAGEIAKQHEKGILQGDLHLDNFILDDDRVFSIDPAQMRFWPRIVSRRSALSQVALLARNLAEEQADAIRRVFDEYGRFRCWQLSKADWHYFSRKLSWYREKVIKRGLKKCLRTSRRYIKVKDGRSNGVFYKKFCQGNSPVDFMRKVDSLMDSGDVLKVGNTSYVSKINWNGQDAVVKRYNHKGFFHSLRFSIKRSRGFKGWLDGHMLDMRGISTPRPLAYIERRKFCLVWESYFVMEYVQARSFYNIVHDSDITREMRSKITKDVLALLEHLGRHRITHGDLKHSNILITETGPTIIDLDAMISHKFAWSYRLRRARDIKRFYR